jgi:hypothetical protein
VNLYLKSRRIINFLAICLVTEAAAKMGIKSYTCQVLFSLFSNIFFTPKNAQKTTLFLKGTQM